MTFYLKKKLKLPKFQDPILCDFACFGGDFSLQMALQMRKFIVEPCYGYLKHSPDSGEYVSKKIMVIRYIELNLKQENDILPKKEVKKKGSLHRTVVTCVI